MKKTAVSFAIMAICSAQDLPTTFTPLSDVVYKSNTGSYVFSPLGANEIFKNIQSVLSSSEQDPPYPYLLEQKQSAHQAFQSRTYAISDTEVPLESEEQSALMKTAGVISLKADFSNPTTTTAMINQRVNCDTDGIILKTMKSEDISPDTGLILLNTIYAKTDWKQQLSPSQKGLLFEISEYKKSSVRSSYGTIECYFYETGDVYLVGLETKVPDFQMVFKLNKSGHLPLPVSYEELINFQQNRGTLQEVNLTLPHGLIESTIDLKTIQSHKWFENILHNQKMTISLIKQVVCVEWDGKGFIGAPATVPAVRLISLPSKPNIELIINRPFSFALIKDTPANPLIVFEGCILDENGLVPYHEPKHQYGCHPTSNSMNQVECE